MENSWRRNSESIWQQSATTSFAASASHDRNLFSPADQHFSLQRPQKRMMVTHGMIQEDMVPHMRGSNNMVSADLGASYLSLLSGPLAQLPHDLQHLSNQKPIHMSSQVSFNEMIASGFSAESRVPLLPGALYLQNMGCQNGRFGEVVLQLTSSSPSDGVYHGNSSMQLQDANLNFRKLQTVRRQNSHGNEKQKDFSSLFGSNNAGAISHSSWKVQECSEITTLQRDPSCINFSAHNHGRNPGSYLPHVFCSGISGKLLLTDTGLLGVVCSCHGLYMSISKFLEHSGSYDDNPRNAIYMDTGDTLAHWCKTFFSETGIRVLEGHRVWDWPEGISAGSSLANHPKSSVSNNTVLLNQVGPTKTSVSCGQQPCIAMNSKENHSCSNIVDGFICHEKEKTLQECSNSLFKDFISSSSGNLHYAADQQRKGMSNSVGDKNIEKSSQSTRTKVNSTCESSNVLFPFPDIQNLQALRNVFSDSRNPNSLMEGLGISSNIELRLGQPTEPSQTPKTKVSPAFGSILDGVSLESQKVFMDHLPQKSSKFEALQATLQFADIASGSCEGIGTTQSEHPNHVGGAFGAITDYPTGSFSHVMEMTDQNPLSLSYFRNPESRGHLTTTNYMGNANHVEQQMHSEDASKSDQLCFPWSEATGIGSKISNAQNHVEKEKEVESTVNGLFGARELDLKFSNILMEDLSTSNVDLGKSSYSYYPGSRVKKPMSAIIANKSHDRDILNNSWKSAPLNINHVKYDETMTMAFSSKSSASVPCKTSIWPKDKGSRINSGFRDVSLKMTAARSMSESSNRDTAPASDDARVPCQLSCNLHPMEQRPPSAKEQCSQILQHVCAPEKWSSAVPPKNLIEKYVLNNDTCNLVKDKDRSANGVFTSLFHDKSCICAEAIAKPFEISETLGSKNMKRDESQYFQWRDVPRKLTASCSRARKDHQAGSESINGNLRSPASDAAKCLTRSVQTVVSLKENEISYASSSLSGPEITQASIGIKKIDRNVRCTNNLVLDEGSRNDKSWSSVDAREKENCTEPFDSVSNIGLTERRSLQEVGKEPFPSLFEELRLLDSLKPKHKKYQYHRNSTFQEGRDNLQTTELISKKRKKIEWMKPDPSFTVSGLSSVSKGSPKCSEEVGQNASSVWDMQRSVEWDEVSPKNCEDSVEESFKQRISAFSAYKDISLNRDLNRVHHQQLQTAEEQKIARFDGDNLATPEIFRTKRLKVNCACASSEQIQQMRCNDVGLAEKNISVDRLCSGPMNFYKWMARPIVSGKYGIISNGNLSKPVKVLPLRHILKKVVHHAEISNISLAYSHGNDKVKFTSAKIIKKSVGNVKEISRDEKGLHGEVKASAMLDVVSIELKHHEPSGVTETESCSASKGCNDLSCKGSGKCKTNHFITDKKGRDRLKTKFKEPRNRSIHELLIKGKGSTTRYHGELTNEPANDEVQTNELNNAKRNLERPRHKKLNVLCCGCGGPNKDKYNQVRECKRCSPKGLLHSEDKAIDLDICKRGMVHAPSLSLQAGENSLTCARTEGYKGRKREGFWHNHVQESKCNAACLVPQEQLNAWLHIHRRKLHRKGRPKLPSSNVDSNCRKAYARYKQLKEWKHLVVYKSGIHALGLYTSQFISCGAMVVEYVGEIVGLRVADKREREYHSGKKVQHKSACYFFRIDKEHIIDATRKGGIARFVNHSCLPNCAAKVISVRNEKKVVFLAERDIYPGEEITYDYHFNHEDEGEKIACYCNSKNCRRYLN